MDDRLAPPSTPGSSLARAVADPLAHSLSAAPPAAGKQKRKPPGLTSLSMVTVAPASTFNLSETGSFEKGGFKIKASGISATPARRGDFSSLTLEQLDLLDTLGAGACGTVRRARHRTTGKALALKVISVMGEQGQRHQVLNELRLLCTLEHTCLVPLLDAFYLDGNIYLALGYMDGGSLEALLAAYVPIAQGARLTILGPPEQIIAHIVLQVLAALAYLHARGVVHRDLKPANILLDKQGNVKVADFGISKQLEQTFGVAQSFVGTATYMAPERVHGAEYSTGSDVWSLGMITLECAQGFHPYARIQSYYDLVVELSDGAPPPTLPPDLFTDPLRNFTAACLCSRPALRPPAAALLSHPFPASSHGLLPNPAAAQPTTPQLLTIAAFRLRDWVRQTFAPSSTAPGPTGSYANAYAFDPATCASPCSAHSAPSEAASASSEDDSAARIQAALRGASTRRELEEMRELVALSVLEQQYHVEHWQEAGWDTGGREALPGLPEEAEVAAVAERLGRSSLAG